MYFSKLFELCRTVFLPSAFAVGLEWEKRRRCKRSLTRQQAETESFLVARKGWDKIRVLPGPGIWGEERELPA